MCQISVQRVTVLVVYKTLKAAKESSSHKLLCLNIQQTDSSWVENLVNCSKMLSDKLLVSIVCFCSVLPVFSAELLPQRIYCWEIVPSVGIEFLIVGWIFEKRTKPDNKFCHFQKEIKGYRRVKGATSVFLTSIKSCLA